MKFPELVIENFLAITEAKINLADRGLVAIQGFNHADTSAGSNGAGKSSIVDALSWCWYGETARGLSGDDVVNRDAKKNCRVVSTVVDGHMTYTATRHRKHKTGKNTFTLSAFDGLKIVDLTKGTEKLTQEVALQILGASHEVFTGSIYAGQEKMPDLPAMTDKMLKMLIEEAAGVTVLEAAYKRARESHAAAIAARDSQAMTATGLSNSIVQLNDDLVTCESRVAAWKVTHEANIEAVRNAVVAAVPPLKTYKAQIEAIDFAALKVKLEALDAQIAAVGKEHVEFSRLERELGQAQLKLSNLSQAANTHGALAKRFADEVDTVKHQVGCPCDSCGRPLTAEEIAPATKAAENRRDTAIKAEAEVASQRDAQQKVVQAAQEARDAFAASMTNISAATAQRASLQREIDAYGQLVQEQTLAMTKARNLKERLDQLTAETNPHEAQLVTIRSGIATTQTRLKAATEELAKRDYQVEVEAEVVKVFGPAGVRARILDEVTPFLNAQTSKYLGTLSDGNIDATWTTLTANAKGELKEKFSIDVDSVSGGQTFKGMSGGEKRKIRIATALALQDLVATRATKPIELFIGDEIDDALAPEGLERLTMVLEEKARERGSVFVISHNEMRDHIKQVLQIEKLANKSTKITELAA